MHARTRPVAGAERSHDAWHVDGAGAAAQLRGWPPALTGKCARYAPAHIARWAGLACTHDVNNFLSRAIKDGSQGLVSLKDLAGAWKEAALLETPSAGDLVRQQERKSIQAIARRHMTHTGSWSVIQFFAGYFRPRTLPRRRKSSFCRRRAGNWRGHRYQCVI